MNFDIIELLEETQNALIKGAIASFISVVIARIFLPKPTAVQIEEGIPTEIYTIGRRGNPKAVYITTQKHRLNILPALCMLAAAVGVAAAKKQLDDTITITQGK